MYRLKSRKERVRKQRRLKHLRRKKQLKKMATTMGTTLAVGTAGVMVGHKPRVKAQPVTVAKVSSSSAVDSSSLSSTVSLSSSTLSSSSSSSSSSESSSLSSNNSSSKMSSSSSKSSSSSVKESSSSEDHSKIVSNSSRQSTVSSSSSSKVVSSSKQVSSSNSQATSSSDKASSSLKKQTREAVEPVSSSSTSSSSSSVESSSVKHDEASSISHESSVKPETTSSSVVKPVMSSQAPVQKEAREATSQPVQLAAQPVQQEVHYDYSGYPANVRQFLQDVGPVAAKVAKENNIYASVMLAQAALESGWGQSGLAVYGHNLFGVKYTGHGDYITMPTQECYNGQWCTINAKFQKYDSWYDSLTDYARLIRSNWPGSTRDEASTPQVATANLSHGVYGAYATDPNYANSLDNMIATYNLTQFDSYSGSVSQNTSQHNSDASNSSLQEAYIGSTNNNRNGDTYVVKAGDTLWGISQNYDTTVSHLKSMNNLHSDLIYVGQTLKVRESTSQPATASVKNDVYTVKSGDTLWGISHQYGTTVDQLKTLNDLSSDTIYVGQQLKLNQTESNDAHQGSIQGSYTVQRGDTLWSIAQNHGTSVQQLQSLNHLDSDVIYVGQQLKLDGDTNSGNQDTKCANGDYTVSAGDTLWKIAQEYGMTVAQLKALNHLDSDTILVGQQLIVDGQVPTSNDVSHGTGRYQVQNGDTLWRIAEEHGMTVQELKALNNLDSDTIMVGQELNVNGSSTDVHPTDNGEYTVSSGDSLWQIAAQYGTTVEHLKALNGLKSDLIYVGQKLKY